MIDIYYPMGEDQRPLMSQDPRDGSDDDSTMSNGSSSSSSSLETTDDAISSSPQHSSSSCFSSSDSSESLYDFSELMDQLPIKRGLSMFYQGKSESFRSLSKVSSLDDLKKKEIPYNTTDTRSRIKKKTNHKKFNKYKSFNLPKPTTRFKKTPTASFSSSFSSKRVSFVCRNTTTHPKITSLLKD